MPIHDHEAIPIHVASLISFIELFNKTPPLEITLKESSEPYVHNGFIQLSQRKITFDWQKRDNHWISGRKFPFKELAQFERKFEPKMGIELTIQCNRTETHFAVAWHKDFGKSVNVDRKSKQFIREKGKMRTTKKFIVFGYSEISKFKEWLKKSYHNIENLRRFLEKV